MLISFSTDFLGVVFVCVEQLLQNGFGATAVCYVFKQTISAGDVKTFCNGCMCGGKNYDEKNGLQHPIFS